MAREHGRWLHDAEKRTRRRTIAATATSTASDLRTSSEQADDAIDSLRRVGVEGRQSPRCDDAQGAYEKARRVKRRNDDRLDESRQLEKRPHLTRHNTSFQ